MESGLISTGFQLGLVQIEIPNYEPPVRLNPPDSPWLWVTEYEDDIFFIGDEFRLTFDKCTGEISEWRCQGTKMLTEALAPNFWRVITDNDFGNRMDARCKVSKEASNNRELKEITLLAIDSNLVTLGVAYYFPDVYARYKMLYHINAFSEIMVDNSMELLEIPRPDIDVLTDQRPNFGEAIDFDDMESMLKVNDPGMVELGEFTIEMLIYPTSFLKNNTLWNNDE